MHANSIEHLFLGRAGPQAYERLQQAQGPLHRRGYYSICSYLETFDFKARETQAFLTVGMSRRRLRVPACILTRCLGISVKV